MQAKYDMQQTEAVCLTATCRSSLPRSSEQQACIAEQQPQQQSLAEQQ